MEAAAPGVSARLNTVEEVMERLRIGRSTAVGDPRHRWCRGCLGPMVRVSLSRRCHNCWEL